VLTTSSLVPVQNLDPGEANYQDLKLKQSVSLLESLGLCWREDILALSCSDKFLRLSLQLLSRSVLGGMLTIYFSLLLTK
jgi:conserved oligomeric Golgi complex subunit 2